METFKRIQKDWLQKFCEIWTSCAVAMVGGDLTVISLKHAMIAGKTGVMAATAVVIAKYLARVDNKFMVAWITGVITMMCDLLSHANHSNFYGDGWWHEAAITGVGAAILGLLLSGVLHKDK